MRKIIYILVVISTIALFSCKSSFPAAGTLVECNGQTILKPEFNPTKKPEFLGGSQAMIEFLNANLNPPKEVINRKIKSKVRVAFIITKEGEICDVRVTSKPKKYLDDEVIRVIKMMPKWTPAINEGKIVNSYYLLDIVF
jgi:TonB family protein